MVSKVTIHAGSIQSYYDLWGADELIIDDRVDSGSADTYINTHLQSIKAEGNVLTLNLLFESGEFSITLYNVDGLKKITVKTQNGESEKNYENESFDQLMLDKIINPEYGATIIGSVLSDKINANKDNMYIASYGGNDDITLTGGGYHQVYTGNGDKKINIENTETSTGATVVTGIGDDSIEVTGKGSHYVAASEGNNNVTITNTSDASNSETVVTGAGNDTISLHGDGYHYVSTYNGTNDITVEGNASRQGERR